MMPAAMMLATAWPGFRNVVERGEYALRALGLGQQLDRDFGDHGEQSFGAGDERQQIVARRVEAVAADFEQFAFDGERAQLQDVVHGESVLEAVHAAGILGDVAADGARDLARRVGRVVKPVLRGGFRDREIAHAGLHARGARRADRCRGCA